MASRTIRFPSPPETISIIRPALTPSEIAYCERIFADYLIGKGDPELAAALRRALAASKL